MTVHRAIADRTSIHRLLLAELAVLLALVLFPALVTVPAGWWR